MLKMIITCLFLTFALASCTGTTVVHLETDAYAKLADVKLGASSGDVVRDRAIANEARRQFSKLVPDPQPYLSYTLTISPPEKTKKTDAKDYKAMQSELKKDAKLREKFLQLCRKELAAPDAVAEMAVYTHTSSAKALEVACQRLTAALASGRLSYSSFEKARQGLKTKEMIAILAGR